MRLVWKADRFHEHTFGERSPPYSTNLPPGDAAIPSVVFGLVLASPGAGVPSVLVRLLTMAFSHSRLPTHEHFDSRKARGCILRNGCFFAARHATALKKRKLYELSKHGWHWYEAWRANHP